MINFKRVTFIKSVTDLSNRPELSLDEIVFVGKSNVGKSTLINSITNNKSLAKSSSKPGCTKLLNYFLVDDKFYFVDAPGYGYTNTGTKHLDNFAKMMESYFDNDKLKSVIFLLDSRRTLSEDDLSFYEFVKDKNIDIIIIFTKYDKLNQKEKHQIKVISDSNFKNEKVIFYSFNDNRSIEEIKKEISKVVN